MTSSDLPPDTARWTELAPEAREFLTRGLAAVLGIEIEEIHRDRVVLTMPVDDRTRQPFGYLHGGASVALAEAAVSVAAYLNVDRATQAAFGLEINANHLRSKSDGVVRATATPIHRGRSTQVWSVEIRDEDARLISVSRCTIAVVSKRADSNTPR